MIVPRDRAPETKILSVREVKATAEEFIRLANKDGGAPDVLRRLIRSYVKRKKAA